MGNVSVGREKTEDFDQAEGNMEYGHEPHAYAQGHAQVSSSSYRAHMLQSAPPHNSPRAYQFPLMFTPQVPVPPSQNPDQIMQMPSMQYQSAVPEKRIATAISWIHGGTQVAIEGSWDNWRTREILEGSGSEFSTVKVLNAGVYHYRFFVDGQWAYAPELPHECDNIGNVFNILDLKENYPENLNTCPESEHPSSPTSSYNNAPLTLEDLNAKLPELPPLLQQTPLNQPSSSKDCPEALQKPSFSNLNHLYIQKGDQRNQLAVALTSTLRFRSKFVTTVLYKPLKKVKK